MWCNTKIIKLISPSIIIIILYLYGASGSTNTFDLGGEPSYSLLIKTNNTQLNLKDNFKIELIISGSGDVDFSKIFVFIPEYIVMSKKIKVTKINYTCAEIDRLTNTKLCRGEPITRDETPSFWSLIPSNYYENPYISGKDQYFGTQLTGAAPISFGEVMYSPNSSIAHYAPLTIDFAIADDAPPGDHNIQITYSYKNRERWYQDRQDIKIHVNRFYETYYFYIITAVFTLLSFIVLITQIIKDLRNLWNKCIG